MGTYNFTAAQTGLESDAPIDARWIRGSDPFICVHPVHDGTACYDPDECAQHVYDMLSVLSL